MKTKILVAGIGGVGGYFGGQLAKAYVKSDKVEVYFLARGAHLKAIQENGLTLVQGTTTTMVHPAMASDNANDFGKVDVVVVCTKAYDLKSVLQQLAPCVSDQTVILPLLNGVSHSNIIQEQYPNNIVLNGCVYIVARLKEAGTIENSGNIQTLYMGVDGPVPPKAQELYDLLKGAGIEAHLSGQISSVVWEKFIFLSPIASLTSNCNASIGQILENAAQAATLEKLLNEVVDLAQAKGIVLDAAIKEKTMRKYQSLPYGTTSSMHSDFTNKKPFTEVESLCGYVVEEAARWNVPVQEYARVYAQLKGC